MLTVNLESNTAVSTPWKNLKQMWPLSALLPRVPVSGLGHQVGFTGGHVLLILSIGYENMYMEVSETGYRGFLRNASPFVVHYCPSRSAIEQVGSV
jgi:hypothetical protein